MLVAVTKGKLDNKEELLSSRAKGPSTLSAVDDEEPGNTGPRKQEPISTIILARASASVSPFSTGTMSR